MVFTSLVPDYQSKKSTGQKVVLEGEEYDVGMNFYNIGACDCNKEVIVCIGSEILDPAVSSKGSAKFESIRRVY